MKNLHDNRKYDQNINLTKDLNHLPPINKIKDKPKLQFST